METISYQINLELLSAKAQKNLKDFSKEIDEINKKAVIELTYDDTYKKDYTQLNRDLLKMEKKLELPIDVRLDFLNQALNIDKSEVEKIQEKISDIIGDPVGITEKIKNEFGELLQNDVTDNYDEIIKKVKEYKDIIATFNSHKEIFDLLPDDIRKKAGENVEQLRIIYESILDLVQGKFGVNKTLELDEIEGISLTLKLDEELKDAQKRVDEFSDYIQKIFKEANTNNNSSFINSDIIKIIQKIADSLDIISEKIDKIPDSMSNAFSDRPIESWKKSAIDSIEEVKDYLNNNVMKTLLGWTEGDKLRLGLEGRKLHERSFGFASSGRTVGGYSYDKENASQLSDEILELATKKGIRLSGYGHSHSLSRSAMFSPSWYDGDTLHPSDIMNFIDRVENKNHDISQEIVKSLDEVLIFNSRQFYEDFSNYFTKEEKSKTTKNIAEEFEKTKFWGLDKNADIIDIIDSALVYFRAYEKKFGSTGYSEDDFTSILSNLYGNIDLTDAESELIRNVNALFNQINVPQILESVFQGFKFSDYGKIYSNEDFEKQNPLGSNIDIISTLIESLDRLNNISSKIAEIDLGKFDVLPLIADELSNISAKLGGKEDTSAGLKDSLNNKFGISLFPDRGNTESKEYNSNELTGALHNEGSEASTASDNFYSLNSEKRNNIELNSSLKRKANESAKALANEAEKAEMADKALTGLNDRKDEYNRLTDEVETTKNVKPQIDAGKFTRDLTNQLDEYSAYINVRPDVIPDKFADEVTGNLTQPAFIDVRPLINAESIQHEIERGLRDKSVIVQVETEIAKSENDDEITTLSSLLDPLTKVKQSILEKNQLLAQEGEIAKTTVWSEIDGFNLLLACLEEIVKAIGDLKGKFGDISFTSLNTLINKLSDDNASKRVQTLTENLDKLANHLKGLNIDNIGFIDAVNQIIEAGKGLKDVVKDAEAVSDASKKSSGKVKSQKDPAVSLIKELSKKNEEILRLYNKKNTVGLTAKEEGSLTVLTQQYNRLQQQIENIGITSDKAKKAYQSFIESGQDVAIELEASNKRASEIASDKELISKQKELENLSKKLDNILNKTGIYKEEFRDQVKNALVNPDDLKDLDEYNTKIKEYQDLINNSSNKSNKEGTFLKLESYQKSIAETLNKNTAMSNDLENEFKNLQGVIDQMISQGKFADAEVVKVQRDFERLNRTLQESGKTGRSFFDTMSLHLKHMNARFFAQFFSFYDIIRYTRELFGTIQELDTALVDLRKTTSMSSEELNQFYYESGKVAKEMGVTSTEIIQTAANWSRLGYSSKEAATEMAALSSQFAAISPGMDVEKATDGLVSSMKAFHVEVESVESDLMDPINRLGNTMATTNEEIVDMLERSSAAMAAANNSINETLALESAAVQITRNAETTGTAFRTISMRIRGLDEETEELSEDLANISGDIADLTKSAAHPNGISLFTDKDKTTYKSTYQLLKDISEVYDELTDKQQAQLLEKLAGKRGGQVLAGILGKENFAEVERAMGEITQAAGSADAEMEIIKDSVEYKLNALKNTWIDYAKELFQRDDIGKILDALINASEKAEETLDTFAPIIEYIINLLSKLIEIIGEVVGVTGKATPWIIAFLVAFKKRDGIASLISELNSLVKILTKIPKVGNEALLVMQSLSMLKNGSDMYEVSYFLHETAGAAGAAKLLPIIEGLATAWPLLVAAILAGGVALYSWYNSEGQVIKRSKQHREELEKLRDEYSKLAKESSNNVKSLSELITKYKNVAKGSDEYYEIANKIAEIAPNTVIGRTVDGDAILGDISLLEQELEILKQINEENRKNEERANAEIINTYSGNPTTKEGINSKNSQDKVKQNKEKLESDLDYYNNQISKLQKMRQAVIEDAKIATPDISDEELKLLTNDIDLEIQRYEEEKQKALDSIKNYNKELDAYKQNARKAYVGLLPSADDISDSEKVLRDVVVDIAVETKLDPDAFNDLYKRAEEAGEEISQKLFNLKNNKDLSTKEYQRQAEQLFNELVTALNLEEDEEGQLALRVSLKIDPKSYANARQEAEEWANKNGYNGRGYYNGSEFTPEDTDALEWYQDLNEEEQKIANSDEFTKELEKQKNKFTDIKDACQAAYDAVKAYGDETDEQGHKSVKSVLEGYKVDENTTGQDKLDEYYNKVNSLQEVINKINTGDYTAMDLNQWRAEYDLVGESADEMVEELKKVEEESRKAVIEIIDKLIETNPDDTELINSLKLIKQGIIDIREEAEKKMNFDPGVDKLSQFSSALDSLKDSYIGLFKDGDQIDASSLMSIREVFGELGDDYADFEKAVLSGSDDIDGAFDKLVSAYAHQKNILSEVNEENKQYYITLLKDKGVVNAEEVVTDALNNQLEVQKFKMDALSASSKDLQGQTDKNSQKFLEEANMSNFAKVQLADLVAKQNIFNNQSLDVSQKITALESLAKAYFGASAAAEFLDSVDRGYSTSNEKYRKSPEEAWQDLWEKQIKNVETKIDFDYDATKAKDASGGGGSELSPETFDWIETKIQRLERDITNLGKTADATYKTWAERTVALGQEMEKVNEQISLQESAYNAYMAKAESIGLSAQYKALVQSGGLRIDEITDETLKENIQNYKEWYEKALDAKDKVEDLRSSLANLAKTKFDNITTQFDDMVSDIDHMLKYITGQLSSVETIGKIAGKSFYDAQIEQEQQRVVELTEELGQLQGALMEGLTSGAIQYGSQMWSEMKKSIYGVEEAIWDAQNAILEFEQKAKEVAKLNFDDLTTQFENAINILTGKMDLTDKIISMVQATGHIASQEYYRGLVEASDQNVKNLKKKYDELSKVLSDAVSSGDIKEYSDEWYQMQSGVEAVKGEIIDATQQLIEYKNQLRQIDWDLFDRGQTRLEQLVAESQFLIDLYADYPLFDKDTGEITDRGITTRGMHVQNYEVYTNAVKQYADEIARLKEEIASDPGNTQLIDRYHELLEAQRQAILNMQNEKKALRDLAEEGYNALLEALKKLIDKYKEALDRQKDLHDYEKSISEQNKNLNNLRKQLLAWDNGSDTSEENRARVQKLNEDLRKAQDQLEETEYDKYINDQKQLLDDFYNELEEWINARLDDLEAILREAIEATNLNAEVIKATIDETSATTNYTFTEEFNQLWEKMVASDSIFSIIGDIEGVTSQICSDIKAGVDLLPTMDGLSAYLDGETLAIVSEIANVDNAVNNLHSAVGETNAALAQIQSRIQEYNASVLAAIGSAQAAAERAQASADAAMRTANEAKSAAQEAAQKQNETPSSSGGGRVGYKYNGKIYSSHSEAYSQQSGELGHYLRELDARDVKNVNVYRDRWLKQHPVEVVTYAKGGRISDKDSPLDILAQSLGEDHMVAAKEGERILTAKQNENFEKLANTFSSLSPDDMAKYSIFTGNKMLGNVPTLQMPTLRDMSSGNSIEIHDGISINLPNITNKEEFVNWLKTDGQIEKIVQSMTLGKLQGKNSYDKLKY